MKGTKTTYGRVAQFFHWTSALLILFLWVTGQFELIEDSALMYQAHIAVGMLVLLLTLARFGWYFVDKKPDMLPGLASWREQAFDWNHRLLLLTALLALLSGASILWASGIIWPIGVTENQVGDSIFQEIHEVFALPLILLLVMHVAGVIHYQFTEGDTLGRMGIPFFKRS